MYKNVQQRRQVEKKENSRRFGEDEKCLDDWWFSMVLFPFVDKSSHLVNLDGHVLSRIDADFEKEDVVLDKVTFLEHFVRDEARESKTKCIGLCWRPLKVLPRRIRNEALDNVTCLSTTTKKKRKANENQTLWAFIVFLSFFSSDNNFNNSRNNKWKG